MLQDGNSWDIFVQLAVLALYRAFSLRSFRILEVSLLHYLQLRQLHVPILLRAARSTQFGTVRAGFGISPLTRPSLRRLIEEIQQAQNRAGF